MLEGVHVELDRWIPHQVAVEIRFISSARPCNQYSISSVSRTGGWVTTNCAPAQRATMMSCASHVKPNSSAAVVEVDSRLVLTDRPTIGKVAAPLVYRFHLQFEKRQPEDCDRRHACEGLVYERFLGSENRQLKTKKGP